MFYASSTPHFHTAHRGKKRRAWLKIKANKIFFTQNIPHPVPINKYSMDLIFNQIDLFKMNSEKYNTLFLPYSGVPVGNPALTEKDDITNIKNIWRK